MKALRTKTLMGLTVVTALFSQGCADLVIKVNKKDKGGSSNLSAEQERNSIEADAESYLDDMDNLKKVAAKLLIDQLAGKDFRGELRDSIRNYRKLMITRATGPLEYKALNFSADQLCKNGKLNLSLENEYLGIILKTALLGKLGEESARALNANLADSAGAIAQLIMMEIGLQVEGDSVVSRNGDIVTTDGDFSIRLLPFDTDSAEIQAADEAEVLKLKFKRIADSENAGTFDAEISLDYLQNVSDKDAQTIVMKLAADRSKTGPLWVHSTEMELGFAGQAPRMTRSLEVKELGNKQYKISETAQIEGKEKVFKTNEVVLNNSANCGKDQGNGQDNGKGNGNGPGDNQGGGNGSDGKDPFEDEETTNPPVNNPGQNPTQSKGGSVAQSK